jgi:drug/metabolite transporter (DMT)-like permease
MWIGVLCGLGAAVMQSWSYIASRHYTHSRGSGGGSGGGGMALVVLVHLWLALMAGAVLAFVWTSGVPWHAVAWPLVASAVLDFVGQWGLILAIRLAEPSRVSPLLTMKVFLPAVLTTVLGPPVGQVADRYLTGWQWAAVVMCVIAGVSINRGGGGMRKAALAAVVGCSVIFGSSDWCIGMTIGGLLKTPGLSPLRASLLAESVLYLITGIGGVVLLMTGAGRPAGRKFFAWPDWRDSFAYGATWFAAMIFLFIAFAHIGVVLSTILQCTRAFITILIGAGLMLLGHEHIEPKQPARVILTRIAAGVLMSVSISLYILRDPVALWHRAALSHQSVPKDQGE